MSKLTLNNVEWKEFYFSDIFEQIYIAPSSDSNKLEKGEVVFIGRSSTNNGLQDFVEVNGKKIIKGNCITISMVGEPRAFYHTYNFTCSQNILVLRNDNYLNKNVAMYLCSIINNYLIDKGYGYGYPVGLKRVLRNKILLPVDTEERPDWRFMEDYIKQEMKVQSGKVASYYENKLMKLGFELLDLDVEWKDFWMEDILDISSGIRLTKADQVGGDMPFIGASDANNGVTEFVGNTNKSLDSNVLGVNYNGSVVENFYHSYKCIFSDDVKRVKFKDKEYGDEFTYLFLKQMILSQKNKYQYGYKFNAKRMSRQKIMLPIDKNGEPHWEYMSNFVKKLEKENIEKTLNHIYIYI
jgi:restriction enzyme, beta subunit